MRNLYILLLAILFIGGCKIADPRPLCEAHVQPDRHSYEAHATCDDDHEDDDGDHDDEPEDDGHDGH